MWKPFAPSSGVSQELDGEDTDMGAENQEEEEDEVDEDDDSRDVEELLSESNRLGWRRLGQKRRWSGVIGRLADGRGVTALRAVHSAQQYRCKAHRLLRFLY